MTTESLPRAIAPPTAEELAAREAARRERQETLTTFVTDRRLDLAEVTQEFVYELQRPTRMPSSGSWAAYRLERVRVQVTRYPGLPPDSGKLRFHGFIRTVNADGRPRRNGAHRWVSLPAQLEQYAAALIVRALTEA